MAISEYLPDNYFQSLKKFLKRIKVPWNDISIYIEAFTHGSSFLNQKMQTNYQRLEFLGDAVLDSEVSIYLYNTMPSAQEGELTKIRAKMIQEKTLAKISRILGIKNYIIAGKNLSREHINNKILADCFESLIGAILVDVGIESVKKFLYENFLNRIDEILKGLDVCDYKTELQEYVHAKSSGSLIYKVIKIEPCPNKETVTNFHVGVYINKKLISKGVSHTRKDSEQIAAKIALNKLQEVKNSDKEEEIIQ